MTHGLKKIHLKLKKIKPKIYFILFKRQRVVFVVVVFLKEKSLTLSVPMSQYYAHQTSLRCHIYAPKSGDCTVRLTVSILGGWKTHILRPARGIILPYSAENRRNIRSKIRKLRAVSYTHLTLPTMAVV